MLRSGQRDNQQCHGETPDIQPDLLPRGGNADVNAEKQPRLNELLPAIFVAA